MATEICQLPEHLLLQIFQYFSLQQLCLCVRKCCRRWRILSYDFSLWSHLNLRKFPSITDIDVVDILSQVGDHVKELNLSGCSKISNLILSSQKISCAQLELVNIIGTNMNHEGVLALMIDTEKFPKLNSVICNYTEWNPECNFYQKCCDAYQVGRKLKHFHDPYENQKISSITSTSGIQDGLLQIAALFTSLESLVVSQNGIEGIPLEAICKANPGISKLHISDCLWAVDSLDITVGYLTYLKDLNISNTPTLDTALVKIAQQCPKLEKLNVTGCRKITDVGICKAMELWTDLRCLVLNESKGTSGNVTDSGLQSIAASCNTLREVKLCFCPSISDAGIEAISIGCPLLESIDLTGCLALTDKAIVAFANNSQYLQKLTASELVQLTCDSVNLLVRSCAHLYTLELETCHYLTKFNFGNLPLVHSVSTGICINDNDDNADASNSNIISCLIFDSLLQSPCRIRVLDLSFCSKIATDSVKHIANYCSVLQNLSLRGCYLVTDSGIEALAEKCRLLQVLDLCASTTHHTKFTNDTLHALADNASNLVMLNIQKNSGITIEGVTSLISKCDALTRLGVSGKALSMLDLVQFCREMRGTCGVEGMNVAYLGPKSKNEYLVRFPARRLAIS